MLVPSVGDSFGSAEEHQAPAAPDADDLGHAAAVRFAGERQDGLPRFEDEARELAGHELDAQAATLALLVGVEAERRFL